MESSRKIVVVGSYIVALVMETERLPQAGETLEGRGITPHMAVRVRIRQCRLRGWAAAWRS